MHYIKRVLLCGVITFSFFAVTGSRTESISFEHGGLTYTTFGEARLSEISSIIVASGLAAGNSGLSVDLNGQKSGNIYFDPVGIEIGAMFIAQAVDQNGMLMAKFELHQIAKNETEIWLTLGESYSSMQNSSFELFALDGQNDGESLEMVTEQRTLLGTVYSSNLAWLETYDWVYFEGEWTLILDPEATLFDFADDHDDTLVPFRYLGIRLPAIEGRDIELSRIELS